ncbi:MAG: hypothetical protein AB1591_09695 [Pseudomonadota bacterium]
MSEHTRSSKTEPAAAEPATSQRPQWIDVAGAPNAMFKPGGCPM